MAIIATGSKTIIDLSDGKSLSAYLGSNQPRTQIRDVNANTFQPDWTTAAGKLVITPVIYVNQTAIALSNTALSITWKRKEGSGAEAALTSGKSVSGNVLTVNQNKLYGVTSGLLTYIAYVTYTDPDTGLPINATADISFALVSTGENAKSAWISGEQVFKYTAAGAVSPAQITLTANLQNVTMGKWQYQWGAGCTERCKSGSERGLQKPVFQRHKALLFYSTTPVHPPLHHGRTAPATTAACWKSAPRPIPMRWTTLCCSAPARTAPGECIDCSTAAWKRPCPSPTAVQALRMLLQHAQTWARTMLPT